MQEEVRRILDIAYKYKVPPGSSLTAVGIIDEIFKIKKPEEKFVLSCGHAGLALYVVIEKYLGIDAEKIWLHHGRHPDRCEQCHIDCSTGSLGLGLTIAVGVALADRKKNVYCLISDGECAEGSVWEALNVISQLQLNNLKIFCNANGWGAYRKIEYVFLPDRVQVLRNNLTQYPFLKDLDAHYHILTKEEYESVHE